MKKLNKSILTLLLVSILLISATNTAFASNGEDPVGLKSMPAPYIGTAQHK